MQITFKNPWKYKTEKKSALMINLLFIASVLIWAMIILNVWDTHANSIENRAIYCEKSFNDWFFNQVSRYDRKRCDLIYKKMSFEFETWLYKPYQK